MFHVKHCEDTYGRGFAQLVFWHEGVPEVGGVPQVCRRMLAVDAHILAGLFVRSSVKKRNVEGRL